MKKYTLVLVAFLFVAFSAFTIIEEIVWQIESEDFLVRFDAPKAKGVFDKMEGKISFDKKDLPTSNFKISIDVNSIKTGNGLKNAHARGVNYFNSQAYPTIDFESRSIDRKGGKYIVVGDLTMAGATQQFTIPFAFKQRGKKGTFESTFDINPMDFGLDKMGDKVSLEVRVPVVH